IGKQRLAQRDTALLQAIEPGNQPQQAGLAAAGAAEQRGHPAQRQIKLGGESKMPLALGDVDGQPLRATGLRVSHWLVLRHVLGALSAPGGPATPRRPATPWR